MLKTGKKILCTLLIVVMCLTSAPLQGFVDIDWPSLPKINFGEWFGSKASAKTVSSSGYCGENVTYTYNNTTKELTIRGTGPMTNYTVRPYNSPFYYSDIENVIIEKGVTSIGNAAFATCLNLLNITISDSVVTIGDSAFDTCRGLKSITIPSSVITIGEHAFKNCGSLTNINVDVDNLNYSSDERGVLFDKNKTVLIQYPIGNTATSYNISSNVKIINDYSFYNCKKLEAVKISNNVTCIEAYAFSVCENLKEINIPRNVTSIGEWAFEGCKSLSNINIANTVTNIDNYAFYGCSGLTDVYYEGSEAEWNKITIGSNNTYLTNANIHYNSIDQAATITSYSKGDIIQFGWYPQSKVTDSATITALNNKAPAWDNWTSYGYYSGTDNYGTMNQGDWMRYTDIMYNGNKYRGVKFMQYRPSYTRSSSSAYISYQDDNGYSTNIVYWFKFEPVDWRVLEPTTGLIMCETIIDSQPYSNTIYYNSNISDSKYAYFNDSSYKNYASDYETSSIRQWLNTDFYSTAFSSTQQNIIKLSTLNNNGYYTSVGTTGYEKLDSNSTNDKIFLLSYNEVTNSNFGFSSNSGAFDKARNGHGSDYAQSQGLYVYRSGVDNNNSNWMLRSPGEGGSGFCGGVTMSGYPNSCIIGSTADGVRPALRFNLTSEIFQCDVKDTGNSSANGGNSGSTDEPDTPTFSENFKFDKESYTVKYNSLTDETTNSSITLTYKADISTIESFDDSMITFTVDDPSVFTFGTSLYIKPINPTDTATIYCTVNAKKLGTTTLTATLPDGATASCKVTVEKYTDDVERFIQIRSTNKSLSTEVGDSFKMYFTLMEDGYEDQNWKKVSFAISDPTVISVKINGNAYGSIYDRYTFEVTGLKAGSTNVVVTDSDTGTYEIFTVNVYEPYTQRYNYYVEKWDGFYPDGLLNNKLKTYVYDMNGLYVNNYQWTKAGDKYYISFDVYNHRSHIGSVDVFDENGEWYDSYEIKKFKENPTNVAEWAEDVYFMVNDAVNKKWFTYEQDNVSEHTHLQIEVPVGGYFTISNNCIESIGVFFFNYSEILFEATKMIIEESVEIKADKFSKALKKKILDDTGLKKKFVKIFGETVSEIAGETLKDVAGVVKKTPGKILEDIVKTQIKDGFVQSTNLIEEILNEIKFDWKSVWKDTANIAQSGLEFITGSVGKTIDLMFSFADIANMSVQIFDMSTSTYAPFVTVHTLHNGEYVDKGVRVEDNGKIDSEAVLQVFKISNKDSIDVELEKEEYELYNICFVKDDKTVQPNGKVKVHVPITGNLKPGTCKIYRQEKDGSWTILDAYEKDGFLVFETDHFSLYAIVGEKQTISIATKPNKTTYLVNDVLDSTGLTLKVGDEIIDNGFICSPSVLSKNGKQTITVTYMGLTAEFNVTVNEVSNKTIIEKKQCGDNVYCTLYSDGELVVSGTGDMWNYSRISCRSEIYKVQIEAGVTSIGSHAFTQCENLESIVIPNSVTKISDNAFSYCSKITSITLPNSLKTIERYAFSSCDSLTNVTLGNNLESIGDSSFSFCDNLKNIEIPKSVSKIDDDAFAHCYSLTDISVDSNNNHYSSENGVLLNKTKTVLIQYPIGKTNISYEIPYSVTEIYASAFKYCKNIVSITIDGNVENIGDYAFRNCLALTDVIVGDKVAFIGKGAFMDCKALERITLGNGLTNIEEDAFYNCIRLKEVLIPNNVTQMGEYVFYQCTNLSNVTIGDGLTYINNGTFRKCINLKNIEIGKNVTAIGNDAFKHCENLKTLTLPQNLTILGTEVFSGSGLISLVIPKTIIKSQALEAEQLTKVVFEDGISKIPDNILGGCINLEEIIIPNSVTDIGKYSFSGCSNLKNVTLPDSVLNIDDYAFSSCTSLKNITLPINVSTIGTGAFRRCDNLTSVTLPDSITTIDSYAFYDCKKLSEVHYSGTRNTWNNIAIDETGNNYLLNATIYYNTDNCTCRCHNYGFFAKIIWKITIFFNKLLRRNKVCSCGIYHY